MIYLSGLLLLILLIVGTASAAEIGGLDEIDSSCSDMDLTVVETVDNNINSIETGGNSNDYLDISDSNNISNYNDNVDNIDYDNLINEKKSASNIKNDLKASKLESTYTITQSVYSTYFDSNGNILSVVNPGDTLDFSGAFRSKSFIINIPLTVTSSDRTAQFTDCNFKFSLGSDGSNISNLVINQSVAQTPVLVLSSVSKMNVFNNSVFSSAAKSYGFFFTNVTNSSAHDNIIQTTTYGGTGMATAFVLSGATYINISSNNVIVNDSNGIYFSQYGEDGSVNPKLINTDNYIFNNTVHSIRGIEWAVDENGNRPVPSSFCYAIQSMGSSCQIINNTVYNAYRGISATGGNNIVTGNKVSDMRGTWYSGNTKDDGAEYGIYVGSNSLVANNTICNSHFNKTSGAAISVGSNSIVTNNIISNIDGIGADLSKNGTNFTYNTLNNISLYGVMVKGQYSNINISNNFINSTDSSVALVKSTKQKYPSDIIVENNVLYTQAEDAIFYEDAYIGDLIINNNTINEEGEESTSKATLTNVTVNPLVVNLSDSVVIVPSVSADGELIDGLVDIFINDVKATSVAVGSEYEYVPTISGTYNIYASFTGNETYNSSVSDIVVLTVNESAPIDEGGKATETSLAVEPINVTVNDTVLICPSVACDGELIDGSVDILINGVKVTSVSIGSEYEYVPVVAGTFNISARFEGNETYNSSVSDIVLLTVNEAPIDNDTDKNTFIINDENYFDYFDENGYPVNLSEDGNYTLIIDSISNKDIVIPSGYGINITGMEGSGTVINGTLRIGDGSDEVESIMVSGLTLNNINKDAIVVYEVAYDISILDNDISIHSDISAGNSYFSIYGINVIGYISSLNLSGNEIYLDGTSTYLYGIQLGAYGGAANPENIEVSNNTIIMESTASDGMAEAIYLDSPINAIVKDNKVKVDAVNKVYAYGIQIADSAFISIGEGKSNVKSPYNLLVESNDFELSSEYMVYGITLIDYGCDGSIDDMGKAKTNMMDLNTTIIDNHLFANSSKAVMGIVGKTYNMSVLRNNVSAYGGPYDDVSSHDILGVGNYALGVQYLKGTDDYYVVVKDNYVVTNVTGEFLDDEAYIPYVSFKNNTIIYENSTDDNGTDDNDTDNDTRAIKTAKDLQDLIDNATAGSTVDLGNYRYVNVSDIKIGKDIAIVGNNTTISSAGDGKAIFDIAEDLSSVSIKGIEFKVNNGDVLVKATATNGTNPYSIETPAIDISNNEIVKASDDVVAESVTVLELESERGVLAPSNDLKVVNNTLESGVKPFNFVVTSVENSTDIAVPIGGNLADRQATVLEVKNMTTTAITKTADRNGEYFVFKLTDANGKALVNKTVQVGFNGNVYTRTTNENGTARVQVNLIAAAGYTFAVSYLGDDNYNASFAVAKITVNKQKGSLTAPTKTYKSTAKTKSLTTTFKDANGKLVSGKKLSFTVNGKTYSATTNSKGVATVKVSLSTKKTYSYTVKFAGDNTFTAISKTGKVTIK